MKRPLHLVLSLALAARSAWAAPGDADPAFNPGADNTVRAAMPLPDGRILAAGRFDQLASESRGSLGALLGGGAIDPGFAPPAITGSGRINCVVPLRDGRVVVAGEFFQVGGQSHFYLARFAADGTHEAGFKPNIHGRILSALEQPDGKLLVAGAFTVVNEQSRFHVARFEDDGSLDPLFVPSGIDDEVHAMALEPNGSILVGGLFQNIGGLARSHLARLGPTGIFDSDYTPTVSLAVDCIAVEADGRALIGGGFTVVNGQPRIGLARLDTGGGLDPDFAPSFLTTSIQSVVVQADGRILVGGVFHTVNGTPRSNLARLESDGSLDGDFNPGTTGFLSGLSLDAEGRILAAGDFSAIGGAARERIARLENDPAIDALEAPSWRKVRWMRSGAAPEATHVHFELSTDGGASFSPLGAGVRIPGGWERSLATSLPLDGILRARATTRGGFQNGSSGIVESVAAYVLPAPRPPTVRVAGRRFLVTTRARVTLRGTAADPDGDLAAVRFRDSRLKGRQFRPVRGLASWSATAVLRTGRNVFEVQAFDAEGLKSAPQRVAIRRRPKPRRR
jgi:uncharacterized delta-60 repeat protein